MKSAMSLNRLEAFSDGVFAIAITLLAIDIKVPNLSQATPSEAVTEIIHTWPYFLSYITSFLVIGVIWLNHHTLFHFLKQVDRITLTINLILLMCVAFIPYPTKLISEYGTLKPVTMFYGLSLALTGIVYNTLWFQIVGQYLRSHPNISRKFIYQASLWSMGYPILYLVAALLSLVTTTISLSLYVLIPLFYLFPSVIDQQLLSLPDSIDSEEEIRHEILSKSGL